MNIALAITRVDVANYVSALFLVYTLLILVYILLNWVLARRSLSAPQEVAYYRAFGPATTPLAACSFRGGPSGGWSVHAPGGVFAGGR